MLYVFHLPDTSLNEFMTAKESVIKSDSPKQLAIAFDKANDDAKGIHVASSSSTIVDGFNAESLDDEQYYNLCEFFRSVRGVDYLGDKKLFNIYPPEIPKTRQGIQK